MKTKNFNKFNYCIIFLALILSSCAVHEDQEVQAYITSSWWHPVNIVFLGDGFVASDLLVDGEYETLGKEMIDQVLSVPPFSHYKEFFNAYIVYAESNERGADTYPSIDEKDTVFDATYTTNGISRLLTIQDKDTADNYAKLAVNNDIDKAHIIIVLVNDTRYGGSGGYLATVSRHGNAKYILMHELGHSIGELSDEYVDAAYAAQLGVTPSWAGGSYHRPNVDNTDNLSEIKWNHFIDVNGYSNVGAHEGGLYLAEGVWRPEQYSIMRNNLMYYNAPSREALAKEILYAAGKIYTFEDFVLIDRGTVLPPPVYKSDFTDEELLMPVPVELYYDEITKEYLYD